MRVIITLTLLSCVSSVACLPSEAVDEWDSLDTPTKETYLKEPHGYSTPEGTSASNVATEVTPARAKTWRDRIFPVGMVIFLSSSLVFALVGARHNAKLTIAFEDNFCKEPDGILWKQFTRLGKGGGKLMVNESPASFKLHANGHRHLEGAVITMTLLRRHEMMSYLAQLAVKQEDAVCLELYVKETCMPQMVLAIATTGNHKELLRTNDDVKELCTKVDVKEDRIKDWPRDLIVYAEHPSYFYDMMTKPMLAQVFGLVPFQKQRQYFRGLHISSDSSSTHSQVIRFWFSVPKPNQTGELLTLMTAVFAMVSQISSYSIPPERQKQAEQIAEITVRELLASPAVLTGPCTIAIPDIHTINERYDEARQEFVKKARKKDSGAFAREVAENKKLKKRR